MAEIITKQGTRVATGFVHDVVTENTQFGDVIKFKLGEFTIVLPVSDLPKLADNHKCDRCGSGRSVVCLTCR